MIKEWYFLCEWMIKYDCVFAQTAFIFYNNDPKYSPIFCAYTVRSEYSRVPPAKAQTKVQLVDVLRFRRCQCWCKRWENRNIDDKLWRFAYRRDEWNRSKNQTGWAFFVCPRHTVDINLSSSFHRFNSSLFSSVSFLSVVCVSNVKPSVECSWKCKGSIRDLWWLSRALHSIRLCRLVLIDRTVCSILGAAEQFHRNSIRRVQGLCSVHIFIRLTASQQRDTGNWTIIVSVNIPSCHIIYVISLWFSSLYSIRTAMQNIQTAPGEASEKHRSLAKSLRGPGMFIDHHQLWSNVSQLGFTVSTLLSVS